MKTIFTVVVTLVILYANLAVAADQINPLTGAPNKQPVTTQAKQETKSTNNMQGGSMSYVPAPFQQPYVPPQVITPTNPVPVEKEREKKKEIKPEDRFVIDGIVNNEIIIKDLLNEERFITVKDMTILDNGGLVKYPSILFGTDKIKALKENNDKDELTYKVIAITKENAINKNKLADALAKIEELSKKLKQSDNEVEGLKTKLAASDKTLTEKHKTELQSSTMKKTYDAELATLKKAHADEISKLKKSIETNTSIIASLEPRLAHATNDLNVCKSDRKEVMQDMSLLTGIVFKSPIGTDYNIPKIGKFKGVLSNDLIFAFVPIESKDRADAYLKTTMLRAYKTEKYILYINSKKLVED